MTKDPEFRRLALATFLILARAAVEDSKSKSREANLGDDDEEEATYYEDLCNHILDTLIPRTEKALSPRRKKPRP